MIDWRKTTHYVVPDLTDFTLSPFVTLKMERLPHVEMNPDGTFYRPDKISGMEFLKTWKRLNPQEYDYVAASQDSERLKAEEEEREQLAAAEDTLPEAEPSAQEENPVGSPEQVYSQHPEQSRNPMQQQQTRSIHTSSRRMLATETTSKSTPSLQNSTLSQPPKEWNAMSRGERKDLVNTATTQILRQHRKRRTAKVPQDEKKRIKYHVKTQLRQDLIGGGVLEDEKTFNKMMTDEGRRRKYEGLPRATPDEKREFLLGLLERNGITPTQSEKRERKRETTPGVVERAIALAKPKVKQ